MEWHFAIPDGTGSSCRLEKSFWLGRVKLFHRGREVTRSKEAGKPFLVPLPEGRRARIVVKANGQAVQLGRPLSSLEYTLGGLPLLLMFVGGALGGLAGGAGAVFNYRLLRTDADTAVKTAGIFGITLASAVVYLVLALFAHALIGR